MMYCGFSVVSPFSVHTLVEEQLFDERKFNKVFAENVVNGKQLFLDGNVQSKNGGDI